jgi:anti-sigma B factor antagonist
MEVKNREKNGVTILDLKGKITIGAGEIALRNAVQDAINSGAKNLVINMSGVTTIDSSGVGELVSAYTTTMNRGAKL